MNTELLRQERAALQTEAEDILSRSESTLEGADRTRFDEITCRLLEVNDLLERRHTLARSLTGATVDTGDGAQAAGQLIDRARTVNVNRDADPAATLDRATSAGGVHTRDGGLLLRDAARATIDAWSDRSDIPPEWQESAARIVDRGDRDSRQVAEWVAAAGGPGYEQAWRAYMVGGAANVMGDDARELQRVQRFLSDRAMNEGSISAGGAAVPPFLDPTIIVTNAGSTNPFRSIADVRTITTQTWLGVTSQGVVAEWTAEAAEMTESSPTFQQPSIVPVRMDAYAQGSWELAEDTSIVSDIGRLFADARDNLEATAFAVGTGSTQPFGIVTELQSTTASRVNATTNGAFGAVDVFALDSALPARWRPNASWVSHQAYWNRTRQFATGGSPQSAFWVDFGPGRPSTLIGHAVYEASAMQSTLSTATASNDDVVVLGDFSRGFVIVDRTPMRVVTNPVVIGTNRRPTGEMGWALFTRVGSRCIIPDAFRMLRL